MTTNTDTQSIDAQVAQAMRTSTRGMTSHIARRFNVGEAVVVRNMPDNRATPLDIAAWETILRGLEPLGELHVICSSPGATLECVGEFGGFSQTGEYFNVQTDSLDMHIRYGMIDSIYAVRKQSHMDGAETLSFQFFDADGVSVFKVFLNFGEAILDARGAYFQDVCGRYTR